MSGQWLRAAGAGRDYAPAALIWYLVASCGSASPLESATRFEYAAKATRAKSPG